jgi:dCMP deaminase
MREKLNVPRGERYELCRSVHSEANAIIHAPRAEMIGATLYLVGREVSTGEYVKNTTCCAMCKRMVINAGIKNVIVRDDKENYRIIDVEKEWIENDDSLMGTYGY